VASPTIEGMRRRASRSTRLSGVRGLRFCGDRESADGAICGEVAERSMTAHRSPLSAKVPPLKHRERLQEGCPFTLRDAVDSRRSIALSAYRQRCVFVDEAFDCEPILGLKKLVGDRRFEL
jgi:hypothetical protein